MASIPQLPPGWHWDLDTTTQRWGFWHPETGCKQAHFPTAGDEHAANMIPAPLSVHPQQSTPETTITSSSIVVAGPGSDSNDAQVASMTGSMATVSFEPALAQSQAPANAIQRKPVGIPSPQYAQNPTQAAPYPGSASRSEMQYAQQTYAEGYQFTLLPTAPNLPPHATPEPQWQTQEAYFPPPPLSRPIPAQPNSTYPGSPMYATPSSTSSTPTHGEPSVTQSSERHASVPQNMYQPCSPNFSPTPALHPTQSAPGGHPGQRGQPNRPEMYASASAPQVPQTFGAPPSPGFSGPPSPNPAAKESRMSKMSSGVGNWVKKHPKMAVGGAVFGEAVGLAHQGAAVIGRGVQNYNGKKAQNVPTPIPATTQTVQAAQLPMASSSTPPAAGAGIPLHQSQNQQYQAYHAPQAYQQPQAYQGPESYSNPQPYQRAPLPPPQTHPYPQAQANHNSLQHPYNTVHRENRLQPSQGATASQQPPAQKQKSKFGLPSTKSGWMKVAAGGGAAAAAVAGIAALAGGDAGCYDWSGGSGESFDWSSFSGSSDTSGADALLANQAQINMAEVGQYNSLSLIDDVQYTQVNGSGLI